MIVKLFISDEKGKRFMAVIEKGREVYWGDPGYQNLTIHKVEGYYFNLFPTTLKLILASGSFSLEKLEQALSADLKPTLIL